MKFVIKSIGQKILGDTYFHFLWWWYLFRKTDRPSDPSKPVILLIDHMFQQDIAALERANRLFSFVTVSANVLRVAADQVFPPAVESYAVFNGSEIQSLRQRYRRLLQTLVARFIKKYHIVAVAAPSDNFFYVRDLIPVLQDHHLPYFVIDKEGTICPAYFTHFAQYVHDNCPLLADHIFVWSERQKQFWMKSGVIPERITVTGQPRSDFWRQSERWLAKENLSIAGLRAAAPLYLFFSYDPWAYTPDYMVAKGEMHWDSLRADTHQVLFTFARQHPDIDLVVKTHPQQPDIVAVRKEIEATGLKNIFLATGAISSNDLIVNAHCIIGFQTTALIEAMVTDKPIVYTFWGEAKDRWADNLVPFHLTTGVDTVTNPDRLLTAMTSAIALPKIRPDQRQARNQFIAEYFTVVDGHSAERTIKGMARLLRVAA